MLQILRNFSHLGADFTIFFIYYFLIVCMHLSPAIYENYMKQWYFVCWLLLLLLLPLLPFIMFFYFLSLALSPKRFSHSYATDWQNNRMDELEIRSSRNISLIGWNSLLYKFFLAEKITKFLREMRFQSCRCFIIPFLFPVCCGFFFIAIVFLMKFVLTLSLCSLFDVDYTLFRRQTLFLWKKVTAGCAKIHDYPPKNYHLLFQVYSLKKYSKIALITHETFP